MSISTANKIVALNQLITHVKALHENNQKVVFTNGCFDILHLGHIDYLEKARHFGDALIVAVNTDDSVRRLDKGADRPINPEMARARILAALSFVDYVVFFGEDTPYDLIERVKPDILVKGDDYLAENIVGADIVVANGGKVKTISLVEGFSTTSLIKKIRET